MDLALSASDAISIHTPIQGVTDVMQERLPKEKISIHTPIQGVTVMVDSLIPLNQISIHTPIQGVTVITQDSPENWEFQSTLPYRE